MKILGIDPGLKGALCYLEKGKNPEVFPMPTVKIRKKNCIDLVPISNYIRDLPSDTKVVIERQVVIQGQGLSSSSRTMFMFGQLLGICSGVGLQYTDITAYKWQGLIFPKIDESKMVQYNYKDTKIKSIAYVTQNYGLDYCFSSKRQRKPQDGLADAICIANAGFELKWN